LKCNDFKNNFSYLLELELALNPPPAYSAELLVPIEGASTAPETGKLEN
jgi:hypothetical protein